MNSSKLTLFKLKKLRYKFSVYNIETKILKNNFLHINIVVLGIHIYTSAICKHMMSEGSLLFLSVIIYYLISLFKNIIHNETHSHLN